MERIPVAGPSITEREISYVTDAVTNAWYGNANVYHQKFERAFADYIGVQHAIALPSCTSAIHLALLALGVGPGDEVIIPDVTWIASAAPIKYVGATTVFADIDRRSWCLSADSFKRHISPKTKAVIPVDLYGGMPEMDEILDIAGEHQIGVIEDAAEAVGSEYRGRKAGSFGDAGVFSFHGSKTLTTGEGGMLVTDRDDIFERALFLRDHGRKPGDIFFFNHEVAYKYKMSAMQAALGLAQLERVDELIKKKREIFDWYHSRLSDFDGITLNFQGDHTKNSYWMVTVIVDDRYGIEKRSLMELMSKAGIDCRPFFFPLSSIPAYAENIEAKFSAKENPVGYEVSRCGINLPSGLKLTQSDVDRVCDSLLGILN